MTKYDRKTKRKGNKKKKLGLTEMLVLNGLGEEKKKKKGQPRVEFP